MEKLQSQLPQPFKRSSPQRHSDLLTQIKNTNSPTSQRPPGRRPVTSSPNNIRSRATLTSKQPSLTTAEVTARSRTVSPVSPEVPTRSRDDVTTPTRRPKNSQATNGSPSTAAGYKVSRPINGLENKQSPVKGLVAKLPVRTRSAQVRSLRAPADTSQPCDNHADDDDDGGTAVSLWTHSSPSGPSTAVSSHAKKLTSPKSERRTDSRKPDCLESVEDEDKNNGSGGSPIYHELDPPGTCRFPAAQHTYQSIVEISDELASLRLASVNNTCTSDQPGSTERQLLSRAKSAQELTQKSPTKLSLFSRFRFTSKKSTGKTSDADARGKVEVKGQRSLRDVDLITRSHDHQYSEVGMVTLHDRQPSFSTFASRPRSAVRGGVCTENCDADGYSRVYVPSERSVPPRTTSLNPSDSDKPKPEPLYRQKFLKIASVHTLRSTVDNNNLEHSLTSSNSVGDLLLATDVCQSPRRVTSYDDQVLETGSRKMASSGRCKGENKSRIARFGLSPGCSASFSSPSCGVKMAEMRVAVRRNTSDAASRSPSASTPVPSPSRLSVFQFNVPPPGVMSSPPVQRAYRHVSSQTTMSVRPPSASCVLSISAVHGPPPGPAGHMQTIQEEEGDSTDDDSLMTSLNAEPVDQKSHRSDIVDKSQRNGVIAVLSDDVGQLSHAVADRKTSVNNVKVGEAGESRRLQSDVTLAVPKVSRLRRPSPKVAAKSLSSASGSPHADHTSSRIVPPSTVLHKHMESSTTSPPSTPRSLESRGRSGSGRSEVVRRSITRGHQPQQKNQVAAPSENDITTTVALGEDSLLAPGVRSTVAKPSSRRLLVPVDSSATGSPSLSSGSSLSLLSTGSEVDGPTGSSAPESTGDVATVQPRTSSTAASESRLIHPKHSMLSVAARVGKLNELTIPAQTDHANY